MLWIKRNLFLAVGGLISLLLLAGGGYLLFSGLQQNKAVEEAADQEVQAKKRLYSMTPFPQTTNIAAAQTQLARLEEGVQASQQWFRPIPFQTISNAQFKEHLDIQIAQLQSRAEAANTQLPKKGYAFSFQAEKEALSLPPSSFPALPMQLAEVQAIVSPLFDAKVNALGFVRRPRISGVEPGQEDYHSLAATTNDMTKTISTPYEVRFYAFSGNLAQIMESYARSEHGIILKALVVEETGGLETPSSPTGDVMVPPPGRFVPPPRFSRSIDRFEGEGLPPQARNVPIPQRYRRPAPAPGSGLSTILDENLLKISMVIYVIRPNPTTT